MTSSRFLPAKLAGAALMLAAGPLVSAPLAAQSSGVFVEQIGTGNTGEADQSSNTQTTVLNQDGNGNFADIDQQDAGAHSARIDQTGDDNDAVVLQTGNGTAGLTLSQDGTQNVAIIGQADNGGVGSLAEIVQSGNSNNVSLLQDGTDNQAKLTQIGDDNAMTAIQTGNGNRLDWTQNGTGLTDLGITQTGGAITIVTQSN